LSRPPSQSRRNYFRNAFQFFFPHSATPQHPVDSTSSAGLIPIVAMRFSACLTLLSSLSAAHGSFLCDLVSSSNISNIQTFVGWECRDGQPVGEICDWSSVKCSFGKVISLDLSYRNISGTLPASVSELPSLRNLFLDENHFSGSLPSTLGLLTNLKGLHLSVNSFSGRVPDLSSLARLTSLYLNHNSFTGPLPASPVRMEKLLYLSLNHNNFTGPVPEEYGDLMSHLVALDIASNQLTGALPMALCQTNTIIYSFHNDELRDTCKGECLEKGCNRNLLLNDFQSGE
jgi:hypothetical protein